MAMKQCIERLYSPEHLIKCVYPLVQTGRRGEMAEWLKARASKACIPLRVSGVRIPLSPPLLLLSSTCKLVIPTLIPESGKGHQWPTAKSTSPKESKPRMDGGIAAFCCPPTGG